MCLKYTDQINDNTYRVTLPFLDKNNDFLEFYIIQKDIDDFYIADDGLILNNLELSEIDFKRVQLNSIVSSYGIVLTDDNQLVIHCTSKNLRYKKDILIKCMLRLSNML